MDEEQVGEVVEKEVDMEKDTDAAGKPEKADKNRPRSATKLEKERQNRLCRAQKQAERIKDATKEEKSDNDEVIEEKAEVEGMETKKVETKNVETEKVEMRKIRKDSEESSSQWETESEVVEEEEGKREVSERVDEEEKRLEVKDKEENDEKETREETKRLAAKIRSAGRRNRRKSSKGGR